MPKTPEEIAAEAEAKAAADKALADKAIADAAKAAHLAEHGFPSETPVADMPAEQQAAYWRFEAKKQQKKVEGVDVDKLKADAAELATLKAANATEDEKKLEQARLDGENIGADKYLPDAVMGRFMALTGKTDDEAKTIFAHVDPKSFLDDKGSIDSEKLKAFATTVGTAASSKEDPVAKVLGSQRSAGGGSGSSSIAEKRRETREALTKKKTNA